MSSLGGPNIVTDGLVLSLDAGNTKSYTSGSTTWYDKSGNGNNGTLVNGPGFDSQNGGSIVFDGVDDYVSGTTTPLSGSAFTVAAWIKPLAIPSVNTYFSIGSTAGNNLTIHFRLLSNTTLRFGMYSDDLDTEILAAAGKWNYFVGTLTTSKVQSIYYNGNFRNSRTSTNMFIGNSNYSVGAWGIQSILQYINASIPNIQIYNRALSAQEILQNYNATKSRFNL